MTDLGKIDWAKVLRYYSYFGSKPLLPGFYNALKLALVYFLKAPDKVPKLKAGEVLCVRSMFRGDYDRLWESVCSSIKVPHKVWDLSWKWSLLPKGRNPLANLTQAYAIVKPMDFAWNIKLSAMFHVARCLETIHLTSQMPVSCIFVFAEMQPIDNALIQFYKAKGVTTVTTQHGLYIEYGAQRTINQTNYECSCADVFLSWGEETAALIKKYNPGVKTIICGSPVAAMELAEQEPETTYVVFDDDINLEENRELLRAGRALADLRKTTVTLCLHPRNKAELYPLEGVLFPDASTAYQNKGLVVAHTTTQLINLARSGKKVFKLKSPQPCNGFIPEQIQFTSAEELAEISKQSDYPFGWAEAHIGYVGQESIEKYGEAFASIVGSTRSVSNT